ncbi:MAG TPA: hypothetical protein VKR06_41320 [Ktedonosporobacter sp.]|nr:hypothetical protein [Ktedonosporobacter sp.]
MTNIQIQALLDALSETYEKKKTFYPVETAVLLAEMFKVQRALTEEAYSPQSHTDEKRYGLTERLINLARAVEPSDLVYDALSDMNRFVR